MKPLKCSLYAKAIGLLSRRDYSVNTLRTRLLAWVENSAEIDPVIARLLHEGYLDDLKFATRFVESVKDKGLCRNRLKMELGKRGINPEITAQVLDSCSQTDHDTVEIILDRFFPDFFFDSAEEREKRRVFSFLQRRGASASLAINCMRNRTRKVSP